MLSTPSTQALITLQGATRHDARSHGVLLQPTDFQLYDGDQLAITGPSGSGKSVLLRALALLDAFDAGTLLWQGQPVSAAKVPDYRKHVAYIAQRPVMLEGTVEDNLRYPFSLKAYRDQSFDRERAIQLATLAGRGAQFLDKRAEDLSGGEAQITSLIRVLQLNPEILLLDEPTAALDPVAAQAIESLVNAWFNGRTGRRRAYLWVSHDQQQARRMSQRRLFMTQGRLTEDAS